MQATEAAAALEQQESLPDLSAITSEQEQCVVKAQAGIRGYLARKQMTKKKTVAKRAQAEELPDLSQVSQEDEARIVKLQASVRGHLARKMARATNKS